MDTRHVAVIALVTAALALGGCGGDTGGMGLADAERYCELAKQVVDAGRQEIELDLDAGTPDPEVVKAVFSDFVAAHGHELDELQRVAPSEVAGDVETVVEQFRTTAETGDLSDSDRFGQAWRRMAEYERLECDSPSSVPPVPVEDADMVGGEVVLGEGTTAGDRWQFVGFRRRNGDDIDVCLELKEIHANGGTSAGADCGVRPDGAPAFICGLSAGTPSPYVTVVGLAAPDVTGVRVVFADQTSRPVDVLAGAEQLGDNAFLLLVPLPSEEPIIPTDAPLDFDPALAAIGGGIPRVEATDASGVTIPPQSIDHVSLGCGRSAADR